MLCIKGSPLRLVLRHFFCVRAKLRRLWPTYVLVIICAARLRRLMVNFPYPAARQPIFNITVCSWEHELKWKIHHYAGCQDFCLIRICTKASTERHTPENKPLATFIGSTGFQFAFTAPSRNLSTTNHPLLRERLKIDPKTFSCPYNMTQLSLTHYLSTPKC